MTDFSFETVSLSDEKSEILFTFSPAHNMVFTS